MKETDSLVNPLEDGRLANFILLLQQLRNEFDAFGAGAAAQQLRAALARVEVEFDTTLAGGQIGTRREAAAPVLERASQILLDQRTVRRRVGRDLLAGPQPRRHGGVAVHQRRLVVLGDGDGLRRGEAVPAAWVTG